MHTNRVSLYFQVRLLTDFNKRGGKIDSMSHVPRAASDSQPHYRDDQTGEVLNNKDF